MTLHIQKTNPITIFQQKLTRKISKGRYCFKFNYKFLSDYSTKDRFFGFEFSFSNTDLSEYYKKWMNVPDNLLQITFKDSTWSDYNIPWRQKSYIINLNDYPLVGF